jgi:hypothetical protein
MVFSKNSTEIRDHKTGNLLYQKLSFKDVPEGSTFVLEWDCKICKEKHIWGEWKTCPICQTPQEPNSAYMPDPCWVVADDKIIQSYKQGPFWMCIKKLNDTTCHTINDNSDIACTFCGGDREEFGQFYNATNQLSIDNGRRI